MVDSSDDPKRGEAGAGDASGVHMKLKDGDADPVEAKTDTKGKGGSHTPADEQIPDDEEDDEDLFGGDDEDDSKDGNDSTPAVEPPGSVKDDIVTIESKPSSSGGVTSSPNPVAIKAEISSAAKAGITMPPGVPSPGAIPRKLPTPAKKSESAVKGMSPASHPPLPAGVKVPASVTPNLLNQGKLLDMLRSLPINLINDALTEYDDAVEVKGGSIRNHGAYLYGVVKRYVAVHERANNGEGVDILPMGEGLTPMIHSRLQQLVASGFCTLDEMNDKVKSKIRMLSEKDAVFALDELASVDRGQIRNFGSYFMGILNRYMRGDSTSKIRPQNQNRNYDVNRGRDRSPRDQQQSYPPPPRDRSRDRFNDQRSDDFRRNSGNQRTYDNRQQSQPWQQNHPHNMPSVAQNNNLNNSNNRGAPNQMYSSPPGSNFPPPQQQQFMQNGPSQGMYQPQNNQNQFVQQQQQFPSNNNMNANSMYGPRLGLPPPPQQNQGMYNQPMMGRQGPPQQQQQQYYPQPPNMGQQQPPHMNQLQPPNMGGGPHHNIQQHHQAPHNQGSYGQVPPGNWGPPQPQQPMQPPHVPVDIMGLADKAASAVQALASQSNKVAPPYHQPAAPPSYSYPPQPPPGPPQGGRNQVSSYQQQQPNMQMAGNHPPAPKGFNRQATGPPDRRRRTTASMSQLPVSVQYAIQNLVSSGSLEGQLDEGILGMIFDLPEPMAIAALQKFSSIDKTTMRNRTAYFAGLLRRELTKINKR